VFVAKLFGATAIAVAVSLAALAVYLLLLGWGYGGGLSGVLGALVYIVVICWPAIPLFILGRRVWRKSQLPSNGPLPTDRPDSRQNM
jgi:hypothetical protein